MKQIILLRGVNVGGRKLPMKTFVDLLEGLGCANVQTYIQSGNAIVDGKVSAGVVAKAISDAVGFEPHVFVTSAAAFKKIAAANPFVKEANASGKSVHLFLLSAKPENAALAALENLKQPDEMFELVGQSIFLHAPGGLAQSKVAARIDRVLQVTTTARNWNTVEALLKRAEEYE